MNFKRPFVQAAFLLCCILTAIVTHAQQRLWGVSVNGELFSMNADGSDFISASSFGVDEYGYNVSGFSESGYQDPNIPTNLVFTTKNSNDWSGVEEYGKVVRIEPSGLKKSNYFRSPQNGSSHGITDGEYGAMHTALIGSDNKWAGFIILAPGRPDGWYQIRPKANTDYSKEYYLITHEGVIYGVSRGDSNNNGFIYKIPAEDIYYGTPQKIYAFTNTANGLRPTGRLSVGAGGVLFGYTLKGGASDKGTFYKVNNDGTGFEKLFDLASKGLTKTESDGKYQTLLDVVAEGYLPATDSEGNYLVHDATGIYRVAPTGYLIAKISSINADRIAFITPRFQHDVKVSNIPDGATGVSNNLILQVNEFTGSNGYQLQLSTSSDFAASSTTTHDSDDNVFSLTGLSDNTTYYTRARAKSWPYYGEVKQFTVSHAMVGTDELRIYGRAIGEGFSFSRSNGDKIPFKHTYGPEGYVVKQLSNGDKLVILQERDDWDVVNVLYKLTPDGLQRLYQLDYMMDVFLASTMVEGDDGWIYTAVFSIAGPHFYGFARFKADGSAWEDVAVDNPDFLRSTKLVKTPVGIFGVSSGRQANLGFIFRIRDDFSGMDIIHQFTNSFAEGARPEGQMVYHDGWLYGTARIAGGNGAGTIFKIRPSGTDYTVVHNFSATFGKYPVGLIQDIDGKFYGATQQGGKNGKGIIYKINPDGTGFQKIYEYWTNYTGTTNPDCILKIDEWSLYSLTEYGHVFKIDKDGSNYAKLDYHSIDIDILPATATNAKIKTPANLSEDVHTNALFEIQGVAGAATYQVEYSLYSDFNNAWGLTVDTSTFYVSNLLPGRTYFIRVRSSLSPAWGVATTFATASAQELTKVISPADGSVDVGTFEYEGNSPVITLVVQPLIGADIYQVQVSDDSLFDRRRILYDNREYFGVNEFETNGALNYYGQWVYARAKTNLSTEWGPTTRFRIMEYPDFPSECEYTVTPNPTAGAFTMEYAGNVRAVIVRDFLGSIVYKNEDLSSFAPIHFGEDFRAGFYFMTVVTDSNERVTRLVKH